MSEIKVIKQLEEKHRKNVSLLRATISQKQRRMDELEQELRKAKFKERTQFEEQETKIDYLELRVQELINLIKKQKEKIIQDFLNVLPEKELVQQLITAYLEFKNTENQGKPSRKLKKECNKIEDELEEKLGEKFVEKIQLILKDCENLVNYELELEERLKGKTFLIEEQRKILQITNDNEERKIIEEHETTQQNQIQEFKRERSNSILLEIKLSRAEEKQTLTQEETDQIKGFFKAKQDFLTARQETIEELQQCLNAFEKKLGKHEKIIEIGNVFSNVGGAITGVINFGIPKAIGESIKSGGNLSKLKLFKKGSKEFQDTLGGEEQVSLGSEEKEKLSQLKDAYNSLTSILKLENQSDKLFNNKYETYDVLFKDGVWKGRKLSLEKMEKAIISFGENLDLLKEELGQEQKQFKEISNQLEQTTQVIHNPLKN